jgi:phosphatidylinositol dimannoside acyltransferase
VTLWYEESPLLRGLVHPPVQTPSEGTREEKAAVMTQSLADAFAGGIAQHPEDWHMLQRLWLSDLDGATGGGRTGVDGIGKDDRGDGAAARGEGQA